MHPYQNIKLDPCPDVADGKLDGRKASAVNVSVRGGKARSNQAPVKKAKSRRILKRRDRAITARRIREETEE